MATPREPLSRPGYSLAVSALRAYVQLARPGPAQSVSNLRRVMAALHNAR